MFVLVKRALCLCVRLKGSYHTLFSYISLRKETSPGAPCATFLRQCHTETVKVMAICVCLQINRAGLISDFIKPSQLYK